jgi:hypothetical protein
MITQRTLQPTRLVPSLVCLSLAAGLPLNLQAGVNWVGVPVDSTTPMVFENPANWNPATYDPVPTVGNEQAPPGEDSTWFVEGFDGQILMSTPRDGSNNTTNAKIGALALGGGDADQVQQLIIATDMTITGRERDGTTGEVRESEPGVLDLRELRVGREDTTPYFVGGATGSRGTVNSSVPGFDQFPWGYVKQTTGTVFAEYLDDVGQSQLKIAGDKDSSAGGLWEVGGDSSLIIAQNGITMGFKDVVSPGAIFRVRGSQVGTVQAGQRLVVSGLSSSWDTSDEQTFGNIVLAKLNRGKSILEFVLDAGGVTPVETTGDLRIGSQVVDLFTLNTKILYGFMRVKLSEPSTAGTGSDQVVLVRSDRITSAIDVLDPASQTREGIFYDPDRAGATTAHRPILRDDNGSPGKVISDYAGVTYTWDIIYTESAGGAIDGIIDDAVVLTNLVKTGGIEGDFDDLDGLDVKDLTALAAAQGSISLNASMDSAQSPFDLDGDGLIGQSDVAMWITHPGFLGSHFGDFDLDGDVDNGDLAQLQSNLGSTSATYGQGDADLDGDVDGGDFLIWQRNFGALPAAVSNLAASVPEPTAALLAGLALALAGGAGRCRRER